MFMKNVILYFAYTIRRNLVKIENPTKCKYIFI